MKHPIFNIDRRKYPTQTQHPMLRTASMRIYMLFLILIAGTLSYASCTLSTETNLKGDADMTQASKNVCDTQNSGCGTYSDEELRELLTPEQYAIVRENGTELPFQNAYWDNKSPGIYVDIVGGVPLFSSLDKFDSGTGWPSFTAPISPDAVLYKKDLSHGVTRTEVRSAAANSHLGHLFLDGPQPRGLRYCINSAALQFIPKEELADQGYDSYLDLFENTVAVEQELEQIILGAGCFWGVEAFYDRIVGVMDTEVGYAGGTTQDPTYAEVCSGTTNHAEVVLITYDPRILTYSKILKHFWDIHDPTSINKQGNDIGSQYRSVIFTYSQAQAEQAWEAKQELEQNGYFDAEIVTEIAEAPTFYPAEDYHQDYIAKNPYGYCHVNMSNTEL